ncbi:DUF6282 family protein [Parafrigoribacterium mesophilum]
MFDVHVHSAPDVIARIGTDDDICAQYEAAGFTGFVLKAHHEPTVSRAAALSRHTGMEVVGGIALNTAVGGVNPAAVLAALETAGRMVWFPTSDSHTQVEAALPRLGDLDGRLDPYSLSIPPIEGEDSPVGRNASLILDLIAEHDAVLCTGHVSRAECRWLIDQARRRNISRVLLTHPSYTVPGMSPAEIEELAGLGAHVEITAYQMWHQPGMTVTKLVAVAKAAGPLLILSSDAGQPDSPPPPEALHQLVEALKGAGLDAGWIDAAASTVPRALVLT